MNENASNKEKAVEQMERFCKDLEVRIKEDPFLPQDKLLTELSCLKALIVVFKSMPAETSMSANLALYITAEMLIPNIIGDKIIPVLKMELLKDAILHKSKRNDGEEHNCKECDIQDCEIRKEPFINAKPIRKEMLN